MRSKFAHDRQSYIMISDALEALGIFWLFGRGGTGDTFFYSSSAFAKRWRLFRGCMCRAEQTLFGTDTTPAINSPGEKLLVPRKDPSTLPQQLPDHTLSDRPKWSSKVAFACMFGRLLLVEQ
ncbi:hypothetical protein HJFPF1_12663 [Paramyrothecium foliicola]|nr:hypothetical protein HJFPF1_12663 [Paramyrothecium foliicola]